MMVQSRIEFPLKNFRVLGRGVNSSVRIDGQARRVFCQVHTMRFLLILAASSSPPRPPSPSSSRRSTTADGRVACTQGMTGVGRPPDWQPVPDPDGPDGWALTETAGKTPPTFASAV